ncbi:hypothetical protein EBU71_00905 [bacterium]|nr:hypothetical protein [Candidatus Elulimicrobium humile]
MSLSESNIEQDLLHEYVDYYFKNIFFNSVLNLPEEERANVFTMLTTHANVLSKLLDAGNHPILDHIKGTPWKTANESLNKNNLNVNYEQAQPLIDAYDEWKSNRTT